METAPKLPDEFPDDFDVTRAVNNLVWARDELSRIEAQCKEKRKPVETFRDIVTGHLLEYMERHGFQNVKTEAGTPYISTKHEASLADPEEFIGFVRATGKLELLERRASVTALKEYAKENNELPPGVTLTSRRTINCNRVTGREYKPK